MALYFLGSLLKVLKIRSELIWLGLYLFVFSFSTFYYSTIGYVDPGVLGMVFMGVYAIYVKKYWLYIIAVLLGTLAKEGIVLLVPAMLAYSYSHSDRKSMVAGIFAFLIFVILTIIVKSNVGQHTNSPFFWKFDLNRITFNLLRPNFYISSILSFGIPGLLCLIFFYKQTADILRMVKQDLPLLVGTVGSILPWFYMIFSAFPDGRAFWIASCFPIALSMVWWNRYGNPFERTRVELKA